jgi:hypothetical protein
MGGRSQSNLQQNLPSPPPSTVDHLHGIVLSSTDGKPVSRVLVTTMGSQGLAVLTDYQGRFNFDLRRPLPPQGISSPTQLAANTITLSFNLRRPGYVTRQINASVPAYTPSDPEPDVPLKITPAGVIAGHISTDTGHLPQNLSLQLRHKQVNDGSAFYLPSGNSQIDPNGDFRFTELAPGDYKLYAMPTTEPTRTRVPREEPLAPVRGTLPAFYPDSDALTSDSAIHVGPGEVVTAELPIRSASFYPVTIPVTASEAISGVSAVVGSDVAGVSLQYDPRLQALHGFLPTGAYTVHLRGFPGGSSGPRQVRLPGAANGNQSLTASVIIHVAGGPLTTDPIALYPSTPIPVIVHQELTESTNSSQQSAASLTFPANSPAVTLNLLPVDNASGFGAAANSSADPNGEIWIRNATDGTYRVRANSVGHGYVSSITSGGTDLLRDPLVVGPNGSNAPIEVTLRNDGATLNIDFTGDALPTAPQLGPGMQPRIALVTAIPLDSPERQAVLAPRMINPPAALSGYNMVSGMVFGNLAPGRYLVLAQETQTFGIGQLEYRNSNVVESLLSKGVIVTLTPSQKTEVRVPLLPVDDQEQMMLYQ